MKKQALVFVGYSTRPFPHAQDNMPEFGAIGNTKDPDKINEQILAQQQKFMASCSSTPYYGYPNQIAMAILQSEDDLPTQSAFLEKTADEAAPMAAVTAFRDGTATILADYFGEDGQVKDDHSIKIISADTRVFVKLAGLCAAMTGRPLLPGLWYQAERLDIVETMLPVTECKGVPITLALSALGVPRALGAPQLDHVYATADLLCTLWVSRQLGLFPHLHSLITGAIIKAAKRMGVENVVPEPEPETQKSTPAAEGGEPVKKKKKKKRVEAE